VCNFARHRLSKRLAKYFCASLDPLCMRFAHRDHHQLGINWFHQAVAKR
jgi:hypothetical protein